MSYVLDAQSAAPASGRFLGVKSGFIENKGQWNDTVDFLAQLHNANIWADNAGSLTFDVFKRINQPQQNENNKITAQLREVMGEVLRLKIEGAKPRGIDALPGRINYLAGNKNNWARNAQKFAAVDIALESGNIRLSIPDAGSDADAIMLTATFPSIAEAKNFFLKIESKRPYASDGAIIFSTIAGNVVFAKPSALQMNSDGELFPLNCSYILNDASWSFSLENADASRPIIVAAPVLFTVAQGGANDDRCNAIALDTTRSPYITGETTSADFPTTTGAYSRALKTQDCFVAKFSSSGNAVEYATFIGGSADEIGYGIAVDDAGSAYVAGITSSNDFPATAGAFQTRRRDNPISSNNDCFVAKLSPDGGSLAYSTYFGGKQTDAAKAVGIDYAGNAYICGATTSGVFGAQDSFPITQNAFSRTYNGGGDDGFVAKLSADGSQILYCSYLGGDVNDYINALALGHDGSLYVTGETISPNFPRTPSVGQRVKGQYECFISKFSKDADSLQYSVVIGGAGDDCGSAIATDIFGNAYVAGYTLSKEFPVTQGALDTTFNGIPLNTRDAFALKLSPKADTLVYSTFLGGVNTDEARGIAVDVCGAAYISGYTYSKDFPVTDEAFDRILNNGGAGSDAFTAKINSDGNTLVYSTFIGGSGNDDASCVAVDASGAVYTGGITASDDLNKTATFGALAKDNAFLTKIQVGILPLSPDIVSDGPVKFCDGGSVTLSTAANYRFYQWMLGGNEISGATAPQIVAVKNGLYTVAVTDASGCTGSKDVMVTVYPKPRVFAGLDTLICPDSSAQLRAFSPDSARAYQWSPAVGLSNVNSPNPIARPSATTDYIVTITDTNNCVNTDTVRVVVASPDNIYLKPMTDTLFACPGDSLPIQIGINNASEAGIRISVSSSDTLFRALKPTDYAPPFDSITSPVTFVGSLQSGVYSSKITVIDFCGNIKTNNITVFVGAPNPRLSAVADTTVCLGEIAARNIFVKNFALPPAALRISGGGGKFIATTSNIRVAGRDSAMFSVQFTGDTVAGAYSAVFYADDQCGGRDSVVITVIVKGVPLVIRPANTIPAIASPGVARSVDIVANDLSPLNESPNKALEFTLHYDKTTLSLESVESSQCNVSVAKTAIGTAAVRLTNCSDTITNPLARAIFSTVVGETLSPRVQITDIIAGDKCIYPGMSPADTVMMLPYGCEIRTLNVQLYTSALRSVYPSPADDALTVEYSTVEETTVRILLVGTLGQTAGVITNSVHKPGLYQAKYSAVNIQPGNYLLIMEAGQYRKATPIIINR